MQIQKITNQAFKSMIDSWDISTCKHYPIGLYYIHKYGSSLWIGVDNLNGCAWTEEFDSLRTCKAWLKRKFEINN